MQARVLFQFVQGVGFIWVLFIAGLLHAHCDGLDGPVVTAARHALESGDVDSLLIWVQPEDEAEIRDVFEQSLRVRKLNADARELADRAFFETVVRVHRAGEGAPFTGLKPTGRDLGPAIPMADKALEKGEANSLVKLLISEAEKGIRERFERVSALKDFDRNDVEAGREYVKAYVDYIHYVERLHQAISQSAHGHFAEHEGEPAESDREEHHEE